MRSTLNIDHDLLRSAQALRGVKEKAALVREGLKALIERERAPLGTARRLRAPAGADTPPVNVQNKHGEFLQVLSRLPWFRGCS
ncbi:MAG: type II toxin-antitoxin system VapB family antitoxin [Chromatiaceae bacterium]